jgi:hypothetical protein
MDGDEKRFHGMVSQFPSKLQAKLDKMPNNRGFVWKGVWFMGLNPADSNKIVMHDRFEGELYIHEYDQTHKVFTKNQRGRRIFMREDPLQFSRASRNLLNLK